MMRRFAGVLIGVIIAIGLIATIQTIGHAVYPAPASVDFRDRETVAGMLAEAPVGSLLFVIGAYVSGVIGGGLIAALIARESPALFAWAMGGFVLAGAIVNMYSIPHPLWLAIAAVAAIAAAACFTAVAGEKLITRRPGAHGNPVGHESD